MTIEVPVLTSPTTSSAGTLASARESARLAPGIARCRCGSMSVGKLRRKALTRGAVWVVKLKRSGEPSDAPSARCAVSPTVTT